MRAQHFKQDTTTAHPKMVNNDFVDEALAKHAARRPAKTPAKIMPITPTLKKVPKLYRRRRAK